MNLIPADLDLVRVGVPLPFSIRTQEGILMAPKGYVIDLPEDLDELRALKNKLFVDVRESELYNKAHQGRLHRMLVQNKALGQIAQTHLEPLDPDLAYNKSSSAFTPTQPTSLSAVFALGESTTPSVVFKSDWHSLQEHAHSVLRNVHAAAFLQRLEQLRANLEHLIEQNPDGTLFALFQMASAETRLYSATHAMLVSAMCVLAAQQVLKWPATEVRAMFNAALTMNIGMSELHDRLTLQIDPPTHEQRQVVETHAKRSHDMLLGQKVTDPLWLEAVLYHREQVAGPLATRSSGQRLARLIQRADLFAARISPRASRPPEPPGVAMQACFFDEQRNNDEAGAALIKAVGIYSPGTYVKLASGEVAVVVRRGLNTTMPRVAVLINRQGMPTVEPLLRDTSMADYRISGSLPFREVKVKHDLERLLPLTRAGTQDKPW